MDGVILGIDLGGTSIKWVTLEDSGRLSEVVQRDTPETPEALLNALADVVGEATHARGAVRALCLGTPGPVDESGAIRGEAVNLANWGDRPLQEHLKAQLNLPVVVKNDTNLAIVGESARGAAKEAGEVLGVFIGTGIGGGLYLHGSLYEGHNGLAGEIGHVVVDATGPPCPCGRRGCVERYASAKGVRERALEAAQHFDTPLARDVKRTGNGPSVPTLASHVRGGDRFAAQLVYDAAEALAQAVGMAVNLLAPEMVVIGGGVAEGIPELVLRVAEALPRYTLPATSAQTQVVRATLGYRAGAIGAAIHGARVFGASG
jgi:glucokinase